MKKMTFDKANSGTVFDGVYLMRIMIFLFFLLINIQLHSQINYAFDQPNETIILPDELHEISGLSDIDSITIACVQDELGRVFLFDLNEKIITGEIPFGRLGDYEGVTYTGNALYVLRSDGMLLECIISKAKSSLQIDSFQTNIPAADNEGLCYDRDQNRLLIGCKSKPGKGAEHKNIREIYGFDLDKMEVSPEPVLKLNLLEIIAFAERNNIKLPARLNKKTNEEKMKLRIGISAIAVHPITGQLFILSAVDYLLLVYDQVGNIKHLVVLDPEKYQKAEGITFLSNGDMLICNEGVDAKATLLKLNYLNL